MSSSGLRLTIWAAQTPGSAAIRVRYPGTGPALIELSWRTSPTEEPGGRSRGASSEPTAVASKLVASATSPAEATRGAPARSASVWQARAAALPLDLAATLVRRTLHHAVPAVEHLLELRDRLGRVRRHLRRQVQCRVLGPRRRGDAVDQPHAQGLIGAHVARGEQQVLRRRQTAEADQARRADRDAELGAGEPHSQVGPADPQVAGDRDLGAAADDRAVAGGDGRLWERRQLVVELREELHPAHPALLVQLFLDVRARREPEVVVGGDHQDPRVLVPLCPVEMHEQLLEHLGVERVSLLLSLQANQGDLLLVDAG